MHYCNYFHIGNTRLALKNAGLTHLQKGIYFDLFMEYFETEKPLPADYRECARRIGFHPKAAPNQGLTNVERVLELTCELKADGWHNEDWNELINGAKKSSNSQRNRRKGKTPDSTGDAPPDSTGEKPPSIQYPVTNTLPKKESYIPPPPTPSKKRAEDAGLPDFDQLRKFFYAYRTPSGRQCPPMIENYVDRCMIAMQEAEEIRSWTAYARKCITSYIAEHEEEEAAAQANRGVEVSPGVFFRIG